jgi:hypothetical protein
MQNAVTFHNNTQYSLVFSNTFILFSSLDNFGFDIPVGNPKWEIVVIFTNDVTKPPLGVNTNVTDKGVIQIFLNSWYSTNWVDLSEPIVFESKDKKIQISILIKSICANIVEKQRTVFVSVWKKDLLQ